MLFLSADQRAGRIGRVKNGKFFRLYSKEQYELSNELFEPQILHDDLRICILYIIKNKMDLSFKYFFHQPDQLQFENSMKNLVKMGQSIKGAWSKMFNAAFRSRVG